MIKLNNIQANKLTGIYNNIWALDVVRKVENDFWIMESIGGFNNNYDIAKRYIRKLLANNEATIINPGEATAEKLTRTNRIEYKGKHITREL